MIKSIELHFSNVCNLHCYYCFTRKYRDNKSDMMTQTTFVRAIEFIKKNNIPYISISGGGEPLLNSNCFEFFKEIINNNIKFGLSTNLTQILKYSQADILWLLDNAEFINITYHPVSSTELTNIYIDKALNHLKNIIRTNIKRYNNIRIKVPLINNNSENITRKLINDFSEISNDIVTIPLFGSEYAENIPQYKNIDLYNFWKDNKSNNDLCYVKDYLGVINYNGDIYSCCRKSYNNDFLLGNITEEIDNSPIIIPNKCSDCKGLRENIIF